MEMEQELRGPPGSPRPEEDSGTIQDDDWLLASVDHWILRGRAKEEIIQRVMSSFDPQELRVSGEKLRDLKLLPSGATVPQEGHLDYNRKLTEVVVTTLTELQKLNPPRVRFWVCGADLCKVPGMPDFPDDLDETAVAARLSKVDFKLQLLLDRLSGAERLEETVANLAQTVTALKEPLRDQRGQTVHQVGKEVREQVGKEVREQVGREVREQVNQTVGELTKRGAGLQEQRITQQQKQSYAESAGGGRGRRLEELKDREVRERSTSSKRGREENEERPIPKQRRLYAGEVSKAREQRLAHPALPESAMSQDLGHIRRGGRWPEEQEHGFTMVQRRKTGAVQKGSSTVEAAGCQRPPISVFVSGTGPATSEEDVKEKLKLCAALTKGGETAELDILKVEHIPLRNIPPGEALRSRCWKVTVSADWAEHMLTSAAYPGAWGWRRWNRGPVSSRGQQQGAGAAAKGNSREQEQQGAGAAGRRSSSRGQQQGARAAGSKSSSRGKQHGAGAAGSPRWRQHRGW